MTAVVGGSPLFQFSFPLLLCYSLCLEASLTFALMALPPALFLRPEL